MPQTPKLEVLSTPALLALAAAGLIYIFRLSPAIYIADAVAWFWWTSSHSRDLGKVLGDFEDGFYVSGIPEFDEAIATRGIKATHLIRGTVWEREIILYMNGAREVRLPLLTEKISIAPESALVSVTIDRATLKLPKPIAAKIERMLVRQQQSH